MTIPLTLSANEVLYELDPPVVNGVSVRAATFPALAQLVVDAFTEDGHLVDDAGNLPNAVFLMHRWFTPSSVLAHQLMALYRAAHDTDPCAAAQCRHDQADMCRVVQQQAKICYAIRYWIAQFPTQFDAECELTSSIKEFRSRLSPSMAEVVDLSQVPSYDWMRHMSVRNNNAQPLKVSLVLNQLEPMQLATHITYLEHKIIRRICFADYKAYTETGSLHKTPRLEHSVALFNGLTQWIQCMVLSRTTPHQRADVITKFIHIAQKLLELQNFNSLMAVVGSLSHSVLARLSKTMACLPAQSKKILDQLIDLLSASNNFSNYRRALNQCSGFKIPIVGIHLKDLISLHVALPDTIQENMINVRKMVQLSLIFHDLEELQKSAPPVDANMDLVNTLRLSLDLAYTDDEIYDLSLAREPRNVNSPQCSPTESVVFAEWAAGPSPPPHPQTIEKHVNAMVEAVFKNYDTDGDGYISHEEFEAVAGNFPFIASFCVLDADHDGMISHDEMKTYFIQANCHALKSGFKHEFHETTYFKPTFCAHCAGMLWGLIRQGYKCRDCAINAHKHCKDLVVMECRIRNHTPVAGEPTSNTLAARRKFRRKKKSSVSESECSSQPSPKVSTTSSISFNDSESSYHLSDGGGGSLPPSPKPVGPHRKISDSLLVPSLNRAVSRLTAQNSCPESCFTKPHEVCQQQQRMHAHCSCHVNHLDTVTQKLATTEEVHDTWQNSVS